MSTGGTTRVVVLDALTAPTQLYQRPPQMLVSYKSRAVQPITLLVGVETALLPNSIASPKQFFLPSNLGNSEPATCTIRRTGLLALEYGAGSARNFVIADLKPGAYALPPCDFAQVSVAAVDLHASAPSPLPGLSVSGAFVESQHRNPARFTATHVVEVPAGGSYQDLVPSMARWVDIEGGHVISGSAITEGAVRFAEETTIETGGGVGRYIERNPATGLRVPDQLPAELMGARAFRVWNDGAALAAISTRFYLDL